MTKVKSEVQMTVAELQRLATAQDEVVKFPLRLSQETYRKVRFLAAHNAITVRQFLCNMIDEAYELHYQEIIENITNLKPKKEADDGC